MESKVAAVEEQAAFVKRKKKFSPPVGVKTAGVRKTFPWLRGVNNKCVTVNYTPLNFTNWTLWVGTPLLSRAVCTRPHSRCATFSDRGWQDGCVKFSSSNLYDSATVPESIHSSFSRIITFWHPDRCLSGPDDERREIWLAADPQKCSHLLLEFGWRHGTTFCIPAEIRSVSFAPQWKWKEINQPAIQADESGCC